MTTGDQQSFWARNRWVLPAVLVVLILAIVLAFTLGRRLTSSSSATATPTATARVVTATPGGPGTPAVGGTTPGCAPGSQGHSTPVPGGTPVPTVTGLSLGMVTHAQRVVQIVQSAADKHDPKYAYYLDPLQVAQRDLPSCGFSQGFQVVSPGPSPSPTPHPDVDGRPSVDVTVSYQGRRYRVSLVQPAKRGPQGIWMIATIVPA